MKNRIFALMALAVTGAMMFCGCSKPEMALYRCDDAPVAHGDTLYFSMAVPSLAKGSQLDFFASVAAPDSLTAEFWAVEFFDGRSWVSDDELVHVCPKVLNHNSVVVRTFYLAKSLKPSTGCKAAKADGECEKLGSKAKADGECEKLGSKAKADCCGSTANQPTTATIQFRLVPASEGRGTLVPAGDRHMDQRIVAYQGYPLERSASVGLIGNSFTFYYGSGFMLKELACSQGLMLDLHASLKGGQYFRQHLTLPLTQEMMAHGGYDFVFLQDQSQQSARHFDGLETVLPETKALGDKVLESSPDAKLVLEATWAYKGVANWQGYGSFEAFDEALQKGGEDIAAQLGYICSPIGKGFELARAEGINLYWQDAKHQNSNGSYLKACINYLLILKALGESKPSFTATASDCGIEPDTAAALRRIAERLI